MIGLRNVLMVSILGFLGAVGCSTEPESGGGAPKSSGAKKIAKKTDAAAGDATKEAKDSPFELGGNTGSGSGSKLAATPNSWCAAAGKTAIVKNPKHAEQYAQLCTASGTATQRFVDLLSQPYAGGGAPVPVELTPMVTTKGQVAAFFGGALKMPVTAEKHYTTLAPKEGDLENQRAMASFQGQTPGNIVITALPANADSGWDRGWRIDKDGSQKVSVMTIRTTYSENAEHYNLGNGHYMYVSTLVETKSTIKDYQVLTAMIDVGGKAHTVSIASVVVDDYGVPATAKTSLTGTFARTIQFLYNGAVNAAR
ncbi:MAG: hypothetical protein FJ146_02045 [Deltaproteobacteria bacterium]|nr:hypothetical protein [Deltaproteobacteria bacterium]